MFNHNYIGSGLCVLLGLIRSTGVAAKALETSASPWTPFASSCHGQHAQQVQQAPSGHICSPRAPRRSLS